MNGLYDPGFVHHDRGSPTRTFQPNARDLTYSKFRPDLAALGAIDGRMPSGLPPSNNDALSRRDMGLEFLDVTAQVGVVQARSGGDGEDGRQRDVVQFTNISSAIVDTHLIVVVQGLESRTRLLNASGITHGGDPYLRVFLPHGVLRPGDSIARRLDFSGPHHAAQARYTLKLLSGQGNP